MSAQATTSLALELRGISKSFGEHAANKAIDLRVEAGTIHAVVGENGAGKSTLLRIAYGATRADAGTIRLRGAEVPLKRHTPKAAIAAGVGMVHQHFMLVPTLTVAENVVLGQEPTRAGRLQLARAEDEIRALGKRLGRDLDPRRLVEELPLGERQYVEIVKALWRGAEVLLLDEPTAVLTPTEAQQLFTVLRALAAEGKTIVLVTHKLDEVAAVASRVTVLRRGEVVAELDDARDRAAIARAMVGGSPPVEGRPLDTPPGDVVLSVVGLRVAREDGAEAVRGVTMTVARGEIVGVAGVQGNGQRELVLALAGLLPVTRGTVKLGGEDMTAATPAARASRGLAHVPEDRHELGCILDFNLAQNLILGRQREFTRAIGFDRARIEEVTRARLADLDVRPADPSASMASLSGGNQQKLIVARELSRPRLTLLVASEPTRGVDIGASATIHERIRAAAAAGAGVLLVSSDLSELRALASRVLVFYRGAIAAELPVAEATDDQLGPLMTGADA